MHASLPAVRRATAILACAAGLLAGAGLPHPAVAATATSQDRAALALRIGALSQQLFEAADLSQWPATREALQALHADSRLLDGAFKVDFYAAGGSPEAFDAAHNDLEADLAEADIAAGAMDPDALGDVANRITAIAGGFAQPFADAQDAPVALKVDAAMFESRRMLDALIGGDTFGYQVAHRHLTRLCDDLRQTPGLDSGKLAALDEALKMGALSRSVETQRELQRAAQDVVASADATRRPGG
jgi:hypothetical protein